MYQQPQHEPNPGITFLGYSGGALAAVITLMILGFLGVIAVCCCIAPMFGIIGSDPTPSSSPAP